VILTSRMNDYVRDGRSINRRCGKIAHQLIKIDRIAQSLPRHPWPGIDQSHRAEMCWWALASNTEIGSQPAK
jgi:hypothetical protein